MAKKTWLCCERCGDIFEGTDGTQYCESCRNILYSNRKHALITCEICGRQFIGGAKAKFCTDCKSNVCTPVSAELKSVNRKSARP